MNDRVARPDDTSHAVRRLRAGDRQALDRLLGTHATYLQRVVSMRLGPSLRRRMDPADVVQGTQLDALQKIDEYLSGDPMPFRWWLRKLAHNRVRRIWQQHVGAAKRDVRREVPLPDGSSLQLFAHLVATGSSPSQQVARRELAAGVRQALAELSETDRDVLLMRNFEDMAYDEIGYVLDIAPATARKRHGRALLRLSTILRDRGLTESML